MKPFRVSNEQVKKIYSTSYNFRDQVTGITTYELALDLLDAREIIDKQEALIKEMREGINDMAVNSGGAFMLAKVTELLEKTKEYT